VCGRVDAGGAVAARGGVDQGRQGQRRRPAHRLGRRHQGRLGPGAPGARPAGRRAAPRRRRAAWLPAAALPCWRPRAAFEELRKLFREAPAGRGALPEACSIAASRPLVLTAALHQTRQVAIRVTGMNSVAQDTPCSRTTRPRSGRGTQPQARERRRQAALSGCARRRADPRDCRAARRGPQAQGAGEVNAAAGAHRRGAGRPAAAAAAAGRAARSAAAAADATAAGHAARCAHALRCPCRRRCVRLA